MYPIGAQVPIRWSVLLDDDETGYTPAVVELTVTDPDGDVTTPVIPTPAAEGEFVVYVVAAKTGLHTWRVTASEPDGAVEGSFVVEDPAEVSIVSLEEIKRHLRIRQPVDDETLAWYGRVASAACESHDHGTGRVWRRRTVVEEHLGGRARISLGARPVTSVTSVVEDGVTLEESAWTLRPHGLLQRASGRWGDTEVTYVAGPVTAPADVRQGVLEMVRHLRAMDVGGSGLPRQDDFEWTPALGYLVPNRVEAAWRTHRPVLVG